jgi:hypothetical protein
VGAVRYGGRSRTELGREPGCERRRSDTAEPINDIIRTTMAGRPEAGTAGAAVHVIGTSTVVVELLVTLNGPAVPVQVVPPLALAFRVTWYPVPSGMATLRAIDEEPFNGIVCDIVAGPSIS